MIMTIGQYQELFNRFNNMNVLVIGDVMIDSYIFGKVDRISPEAPVPVVAVKKRLNRLGGAANVALNLKALGANPYLCSLAGNDDKKAVLTSLMEENGLPDTGIVVSPDRLTTTKFRVIGNNVQMLRVDEENDYPLTETEFSLLYNKISSIIREKRIDVIIFQDYDKGCINARLIAEVVSEAKAAGIPVTVDPKKRNFRFYHQVSLFKPNLKELREGLQISVSADHPDELENAALHLHQNYSMEHVMITLSEYGVFLSSYKNGHQSTIIHPAFVRNIADVSGAGDTVISITSLCLAAGIPQASIALLANLAGGLVCESVGVVPVDKGKLLDEIRKIG